MDYLRECKAFYDSLDYNQLSSGQIALWYVLLNICNKSGWQTWFTAANSTLASSGLSVSGINKARNQLKQLGYIDFKPQGKNKATKYRIISQLHGSGSQDSNKQSTKQSNKQSVKQSNRQSNNQSTKQSTTLNKQNETKHINGGGGFKLNARAKLKKLNLELNDAQFEILEYYATHLSEELVLYTIDQAVKASHPMSWINAVLSRYENSMPKITTVAQAKADDDTFHGRNTLPKNGPVIPIYKLGE